MKDFPQSKFLIMYPVFKDVEGEVLEVLSELALCYLDTCGGPCNEQLWMLLVAHMLQLRLAQEQNQSQPGAVASATIDKVSVSFMTPPSGSAATHWFNLTPYGQQYLALAARCAGGLMFVGGMPERAAFRSVGGRFPRGGRSW